MAVAPEHDELFMMIAHKCGGIAPLLDAFFSFLHRKTDFFHVMQEGENMGFLPGVAEKLVLGHFRKYQEAASKARKEAPGGDRGDPASRVAPSPAEESKGTSAGPVKAAAGKARVTASGVGASNAPGNARHPEAEDERAPAAEVTRCSCATSGVPTTVATTTGDGVGVAPAKDALAGTHMGAALNLESTYNGGQTDKYVWEQTITDVTLVVPLPEGTRSRDISCDICRRHLTLCVRGQTDPVLDSDYPCDDRNNQCIWEQVKTEQSFWNFSDGKCTIYLEKERECWWKSALHGHAEIDTAKVDSVKRVEDYDGETQGAIRKIMFDQDQKRKGLPTSDELQHMDVLKQAWDAEGSPFKGTPFNPSAVNFTADTNTFSSDGAVPGPSPDGSVKEEKPHSAQRRGGVGCVPMAPATGPARPAAHASSTVPRMQELDDDE